MVEDVPHSALREVERIAVLEATGLLDSPAEATFDRFTRLASATLQAPVALVSLVDRERQFFKSCIGLSESLTETRETPLSHSFCQHVVLAAEPLIVADSRLHPLLKDNPAVSELGVIAYLGIPLTTHQGHTLGSFCVIDSEARDWTARDVEILRDLAALVVHQIELRLLARHLQSDYLEMRRLQLHRDEMVHMLIHDLRTPLTSFMGGLELARKAGGLSEQQESLLAVAHRGGNTLLAMVNSILDVSQQQSAAIALRLKEVPAAEVAEAAGETMAAMAADAGVRLIVEAPHQPIVVDADKLRRVLVNLMANAIQHTPADGTVRVSVRPEEAREVRFTVEDTGCGIPPEASQRIFEKFGGSRSQRVSGPSTGLGLPFSRMVVEAHGGRIWVESELGVGTSFHFTIPERPRRSLT